jgi:hypothetical protein
MGEVSMVSSLPPERAHDEADNHERYQFKTHRKEKRRSAPAEHKCQSGCEHDLLECR